MTTLDWTIVALVALTAYWGYHQGLVIGALSLAGFAAGALLGSRAGPALLAEGSASPYAPLAALAGAMLLGGVASLMLETVGLKLRVNVIRHRVTHVIDGIGGAVLVGMLGLGLAWIAGAVALNTPGAGELRRDVQRSEILQRLNQALPPTGPILNALNRIDLTPRIEGPDARVEAPDRAVLADPDVQRAGQSVVRVLGTACGLGVAGSGWVAGAGLVVTNAHVVAGQDDTTVTGPDGTPRGARAVHYDPRNDLAILRVEGLGSAALPLAEPRSGAAGAILGYPENGPFRAEAARLGPTEEVLSQDSYGRGPLRREMTAVRGRVRGGNSGGPVVDTRGRVMTTIFAASTDRRRRGFGVPNAVLRSALAGRQRPTGTGPCAAS